LGDSNSRFNISEIQTPEESAQHGGFAMRIALLLLLAISLLTTRSVQQLEPKRFLFPLPLTERPLLDEPPLASLDQPSPPPPPISIELLIQQEPLQQPKTERVGSLSGLAIDARTRLITSMAPRGARQLSVKLATGFRAGSLIVVNPGGTTEEQLTLQRPDPFLLASSLRFSHGLGETVVQLAPFAGLEDAATADSSVWPGSPSSSNVSSRLGALFVLRDRRAHARLRPPAPPPHRQPPLLGNLTALADDSSRFVRTHLGIEAALALLLAAVLSCAAMGCILQAACDYSLCCFSRGRKKVADSRDMSYSY
jgi:hypothetical protein